MRLDELADFCETIRFNDLSSWPSRNYRYEDLLSLAKIVLILGGFDAGILAAQARIMLSRIEAFGDNDPFFALFDQPAPRSLDNWHQMPDQAKAVQVLIRAFFNGHGPALVAANALRESPVAHLAVPLLTNALPEFESEPKNQRIAASTLLSLTNGAEITEWATSRNPVLRRISAEEVPIEQDGKLTAEIHELLTDHDGHVVESAIERLRENLTPQKITELACVSENQNPGWMCLHCCTSNGQGRTSCLQCHIVGPDPSRKAAEILARHRSANP
jgi:hypothetical protein